MDGGTSCFETTTPDWVFGVALGGVVVAVCSALVWFSFFAFAKAVPAPLATSASGGGVATSDDSSTPSATRSRLRRRLDVAFPATLLVTIVVSRVVRREPPTRDEVGMLALLSYPVAGLLLTVRRVRRSGPLASPRAAPLGQFWLLPVIVVTALGATVWASLAMVASMRPC